MLGIIVSNYIIFILKIITLILIVGIIFILFLKKKKVSNFNEIKITNISEELLKQKENLELEFMDEDEIKELEKKQKEEKKNKKKEKSVKKSKLFVLEFIGDVKASEVESLRDEITAILSVVKPGDEVLLKLESQGGFVHSYGLAASQLQRLKDENIPLTIAVDEIAASGGYMMACVADKIVAAPFSIIGSVGVVAQITNIHKLLKKYDIDVDIMTAGKYKRTVTVLGENTEEGKEKFKEELKETHKLFQEFISKNRPKLDVESVSTGEVWYGIRALELNLIDEIMTSDEYILKATNDKEVYMIEYVQKKSLLEKVGLQLESSIENIILKLSNEDIKIK